MAKKGPSSLPEKRLPWRAWLLIALIAVAAHGLCLRASFFLDDYLLIIENPTVTDGAPGGHSDRLVPRNIYRFLYAAFGPSSPVFHALNLLLHALVAILTFELARAWFPRLGVSDDASRRAALWSALIFACHPLGSEITNYARCTDLELVMLFSLGAALAALRWVDRGWRWLPAVIVLLAAARYSKGPGILHALAVVGIVVVTTFSVGRIKALVATRGGLAACISATLVAIVAAVMQLPKWQAVIASRAEEGRFGWHLLTQCRIAWQYLRRSIWPTDLCADHHIAWTMSAGDLPAWIAAGTLAAFAVASLWLLARRRSRIWGALLCLVLFPILLRFPFVSSELMVEYRMVPALPFIGMLGGLLLARIHRLQPALVPAAGGAVVIIFSLVSAARSTDWHGTHTICDDVLRKYPTRLRAHWEAMAFDYEAGDYQAVLRRQPAINRSLREVLAFNSRRPNGRHYDFHHFAYSDITCRCYIARALARTGRPREAWQLFESVRVNQIEANNLTDSHCIGAFHYHRGLFHLEAGRPGPALADLTAAKGTRGFKPRLQAYITEAENLAGPDPTQN